MQNTEPVMFQAAKLFIQNGRLFLTESRRSPAAAGLPRPEAGSGSTRGLELSPCSVFLHECGRYPREAERVSTFGWAVFGFLIPVVAVLVVYLRSPNRRKTTRLDRLRPHPEPPLTSPSRPTWRHGCGLAGGWRSPAMVARYASTVAVEAGRMACDPAVLT